MMLKVTATLKAAARETGDWCLVAFSVAASPRPGSSSLGLRGSRIQTLLPVSVPGSGQGFILGMISKGLESSRARPPFQQFCELPTP